MRRSGRRRHAIQDGFEDHAGGFAAEGQDAGGHFVEHGAERKEIAASVQFLAANLFGRHVGDGADGGSGAGEHFAGVERGVAHGRAGGAHGLADARGAAVRGN